MATVKPDITIVNPEEKKIETQVSIPKSLGPSVINPDLLVYFSEAFTFRHLINFISTTSFRGNFIFKPEGIYYEQDVGQAIGKYKNTQNILNKFFLGKQFFTTYVVSLPKGPTGKPLEGFVVGLNLSDFQRITQQITKNDGFNMFIRSDQRNFIYTQLIRVSGRMLGQNQTNKITPIIIPRIDEIKIPPYNRTDDDPNCTIPLNDFAKSFAGFKRQKCDYVKIRCYNHGIILEGYLQGQDEPISTDSFGVIDDSQKLSAEQIRLIASTSIDNDQKVKDVSVSLPTTDSKEILQIKISSATVSAFSRCDKIGASKGVIRLFAEIGNPLLKIICPTGGYGFLTTYLRDGGKDVEKNEVKRGRKPKIVINQG